MLKIFYVIWFSLFYRSLNKNYTCRLYTAGKPKQTTNFAKFSDCTQAICITANEIQMATDQFNKTWL